MREREREGGKSKAAGGEGELIKNTFFPRYFKQLYQLQFIIIKLID